MTEASNLLEKHGETPGVDFYTDLNDLKPHSWSEPSMGDYTVFEFRDGSRLLAISYADETYLQEIT